METLQSVLSNYSPQQLNAILRKLTKDEQKEAVQLADLLRIHEPVSSWDAGPLFWLTKHTRTEDTHWMTKGTDFRAPFPRREYFRILMDYFFWETCKDKLASPVTFIPKTREMMISWLVTGYITWMCITQPVFWVAQTGKEDKVGELIEYARILYRNQEPWMQARNPLVVDNDLELKWRRAAGFSGYRRERTRSGFTHPHIYFQDESAFLPEAQQAFDAVRPVAKQIICVSSDEIGWFHSECMLETT